MNSLSCQELVERVTAYFDDAVPASERQAIDAHLAECEDCVRHVDQMRRTIEITGGLSAEDVPMQGLDDLLAAFRAATPHPD